MSVCFVSDTEEHSVVPISQQLSKSLQEVGRQLQEGRKSKGISLRQFAARVGKSPSYYSKVERGEVVASEETYELICKHLGLDPDPLLGRIGKIDSETQLLLGQAYVRSHEQVKAMLRKLAKSSPEKPIKGAKDE